MREQKQKIEKTSKQTCKQIDKQINLQKTDKDK